MSKYLTRPAMLAVLVTLLVSHSSRAESTWTRKIYNVADLVAPLAPASEPGLSGAVQACFRASDAPSFALSQPDAPLGLPINGQALVRLITESIVPDSWEHSGGRGTLNYYPVGMALVATQTEEVHAQLADLLSALRELLAREVTLELRLISVPSTALDALVVWMKENDHRVSREQPIFLSPEAMAQFMAYLQIEPRVSVMQAPKVTLFSGQEGTLSLLEPNETLLQVREECRGRGLECAPSLESCKTGLVVRMKAVVSADRQYVGLNLAGHLRAINWSQSVHAGGVTVPGVEEKSLQARVAIRDGYSAILGGWQSMRPDSHERETVIMLVTTRVLDAE